MLFRSPRHTGDGVVVTTGSPVRPGPRERLLEAATRLTYSEGSQIGIDALLTDAGVARRSLYEHFGGKDGLLLEVIRQASVEDEEWFRYWVEQRVAWHLRYGLRESHLRVRPHDAEELSHYSSATSDIEYLFPIGWSELEGIGRASCRERVSECV